MVHIKTVLAATCAFLKKILQLAQWSKSNVFISKEISMSLVSDKKELTHLEFCGESYDQMSEQRSELPRIRKTTFSGYVVAILASVL